MYLKISGESSSLPLLLLLGLSSFSLTMLERLAAPAPMGKWNRWFTFKNQMVKNLKLMTLFCQTTLKGTLNSYFTRCESTALAASLTGHFKAWSLSMSKLGVIGGGPVSLKNALFDPEFLRVLVGDVFELL